MLTGCEGQTRLRWLQLPATEQKVLSPKPQAHEGGLGKVAGRLVVKLGVRSLIFVTLQYLRLRG